MAFQEMEGHQEEEEPTSADRKREAPVDDTEVMPVGEPKKKRCKDRKLAAEHHRQKPKTSTRENCGPQKRLAVEPPWESNTAHEGDRPEDVPSRDSGMTQERHHEEESYSRSWLIPEEMTGHGRQEDKPLRKYGRAQETQTSGRSPGVTHKST
jgi:hypothetical protein